MDRITLKDMIFYGYHGVLPEEKSLGQRFAVDVDILADLSVPAETDVLEDSINYARIFEISRDVVENGQYNLLEAVAGAMAQKIIDEFGTRIVEVVVRIRKPSAPIPGALAYAEVEIRKSGMAMM